MQYVPINRLLIQPTVQLKWLEQHSRIEFMVETELQTQFMAARAEMAGQSLAEFVRCPESAYLDLHNHDHLFALLMGADYIASRYPQKLSIMAHQPNLVWSIEPYL